MKAMKFIIRNNKQEQKGSIVMRLLIVLAMATQMIQPLAAKASTNDLEPEEVTVTGVVKDETGEPLPGANVIEKGTANGTIADIDGRYTIKVAGESAVLVFSFVGYAPYEVTVGAQENITVSLNPDAKSLEEVVVVGYGAVKKRDLTGAVASVKEEDLQNPAMPSVGQMLQGKAPGVAINTVSAQPGGAANINIRGYGSVGLSNEPLIIIDGYPVTNSNVDPDANGLYGSGSKGTALNSINPSDIESIEVLKDASAAAIYGARAGNGVIIITTKRGSEGRATVEYSGSTSIQELMNKPKMLNGTDFMIGANKAKYEQYLFDNGIFPYGGKVPSEVFDPFIPAFSQEDIDGNTTNTDWYDEVTRTGVIQNHNLSVRGGSKNTQFFTSFNYYDHQGVVKNNGMTRMTLRLNLDHQFSDNVKAGVNVMNSNIKNNNFVGDETWGQNQDDGVLGNALKFNPTIPVRDEFGRYPIDPANPQFGNPVSMLEITSKSNNYRTLANTYIEVSTLEDKLSFRGTVGMDKQYGVGQTYLPTTTFAGANKGGRADQSWTDEFNWQYDMTATYKNQFGNAHAFTFLLGHSHQSFYWQGINAGNQQFVTDSYLYNNLGQGASTRPDVGSYAGRSQIASFFSRATYTLLDKYLFTLTVRADGSSDFSENNKWGYFPSAAVAWRVSDEAFLANSEYVSNLKFRVSYGQTGNAGIGSRGVAYYGNTEFQYSLGGSLYTGIELTQLENPDLKWETTTEMNFGVDLGLFNNKLNITADYFQRTISDLLSTRQLPSYLEIDQVAANIGSTRTTGLEIGINTVNIDKPNFKWTTNFAGSYYADRWHERDENWTPQPWEEDQGYINYLSGYVSDGLIEVGEEVPWYPEGKPGQVKLLDLDGFQRDANGDIVYDESGKRAIKTGQPDGILDQADIVIYHNNIPVNLGLTNRFNYKNFDLSIFFNGIVNRKGWNAQAGYMYSPSLYTASLNRFEATKNIWTHDHTTSNFPNQIETGDKGDGDYLLHDTSFIRLKDVTLGYQVFNPGDLNNWQSGSMRVYFTATNLYTWTKYRGMDPETDFSAFAYPNSRTFSLGVNIGI